MKPLPLFLICAVLLSVFATGCDRGHTRQAGSSIAGSSESHPSGNAKSETAPSAASNAEVDRPMIVAFGDSLTAGYGTQRGESYPDYLQQDLDALGYRYRVVNEGTSGNTSKDGVARLHWIVKMHPAVAIVAFGGNDGLRGIPIRDTEMNLRTIISTLQQAHAKVILGGITLPPNYGSAYIKQFNAMYAKLAQEFHVSWLPFMLKGAYGVPGDIQSDGIHATAKGNRQVAKNFLPLLLPLLQKPGPNPQARSDADAVRSTPAQP